VPYPKQIETLKPRVAGLARLNEKYGMKAMYHPGGGAFVDLLDLVRNFDPRYISIQYDTGNFQQTNQQVLARPCCRGWGWPHNWRRSHCCAGTRLRQLRCTGCGEGSACAASGGGRSAVAVFKCSVSCISSHTPLLGTSTRSTISSDNRGMFSPAQLLMVCIEPSSFLSLMLIFSL
jgi:hypothetical protein